eukprot:180681_1
MLHNPNHFQSIRIFNPQQRFDKSAINESSTQQPNVNNANWQQFRDAASGHDYWYDPDADHSTWTKPAVLQQSTSGIEDVMATDSDDASYSDDDTSSDDDDDAEEPGPQLCAFSSDRYEPQKNDDLIDNALNITHSTAVLIENTLWHIAASQGDNYLFEIYAQHYFRQNKKGNADDLIHFQSFNKFKQSLHKMDAKLNKQSKQIWKNVNSYMLLRKSSKSDAGHIDKLLRCVLKAPQVLRDELFCQICKQTHGNPNLDSLVKGWKLMCIVCSILPPSAQLAPFLATYIYSATQSVGEGAECALFALKALDITMVTGPRVHQPADTEIQSIELRQAIPLQVYFLDGSVEHILVTSQTQTRDVVQEMAKKIRSNHPDAYGLFCIEGHRREEVQQQTPCHRELEEDERIMDVFSSKTADVTLIFNCKLHSTVQRNSYSYNDWQCAFWSVHWNVIHGVYPLRVEDLYHLAAIQIQAVHGMKQDQFYRAGLLINNNAIHEYVPYAMIVNHIQRVEANILNRHRIYKHLDQKNAFKQYFEYLSTTSCS